jgi:hypothetical protein
MAKKQVICDTDVMIDYVKDFKYINNLRLFDAQK